MYEFCYDYVKSNCSENQNCVIVIGIKFLLYIKADDIYKDVAKDVETRFDTSNYELNKSLPKWKNKKVIGLMKD